MNLVNVILQCRNPDILNVGMKRVYYDRTFLIDSRNKSRDIKDIESRDWMLMIIYRIDDSDLYGRFPA